VIGRGAREVRQRGWQRSLGGEAMEFFKELGM
jgi:hypothetical protein